MKNIKVMASCLSLAIYAGCSGLIDATIGGTVAGLSGGTTVGLLNNGTDPITVSANGNFTFDVQIQAGSTYNVTVATQPIGETCTVANGSGTVEQNSGNVTNVQVNCNANVTATNSVFGTISGLATGGTVTLLDNGTDSLSVKTNGQFVFSTALSNGSPYSVTVSVNPSGQSCTVANGSGVIPATGTIPTVVVTCT